MNELIKRITSRGHWHTVVRPTRFDPQRIKPITVLSPFVERCRVEVRGWDFPHVSRHDPIITAEDYIEQPSEWQHHAEVWRLYQSGQFVDWKALLYDWRDKSEFWPPDAGWRAGDALGIGETLYTLYERFEFGARFAQTLEGNDQITIEITAGGLKNRMLVVDDPGRLPLRDMPRAHIEKFPQQFTFARAELMTDPLGHAVRAGQELFRRFGREFPEDGLRDWVERVAKRGPY